LTRSRHKATDFGRLRARATMALLGSRLAALVTDRILMIDRPVRGEAEVHGHPAQYRPSGYFANLVS
jgi:hypothetical protein